MLDPNNPEAREVAEDVSGRPANTPERTGVMCRCCGHESFKNGGSVLCDYCFLKRIDDSNHQCPKLKPEPTPTGSTCQYCSDYGCQSCPAAEATPTQPSETDQAFDSIFASIKMMRGMGPAEPTPVRTAPEGEEEEEELSPLEQLKMCIQEPRWDTEMMTDVCTVPLEALNAFILASEPNPPVAPVRALDEFLSVCEGECEHPYCWSQKAPVAPVRVAERDSIPHPATYDLDWPYAVLMRTPDNYNNPYRLVVGVGNSIEGARADAERNLESHPITPQPTMEPQELPTGPEMFVFYEPKVGSNALPWEVYKVEDVTPFIAKLRNDLKASLARAEKAEQELEKLKGGK